MEKKTPYLVSTNLGGQECYFVELNGVKPHFSDDLKEACFMSEENAVRLRDILNEKSDAYFEVLEVEIVD